MKNELNNKILRDEYKPLTERLLKLEEQYKVFTELNQELMKIKETGDIIAHEKEVHDRNPIENSINKKNLQSKAPEISISSPDTTHAADLSIQSNPVTEEWSTRSSSDMNKFYISHLDQSSPASPEEGTKSDSLGEVA